MLEVETAFATLDDLIEFCKSMLSYIFINCNKSTPKFITISYKEVIEKYDLKYGEDDYFKLKNKMIKSNINLESMEYYLATRRFGTIPHGGFGLGLERLIMYLSGIDNISDVVRFPIKYK